MTLLNEDKPDLVLLDIGMPGPDGYMVLERIRACSAVPVIMLTGTLGTESVQKCLDLAERGRGHSPDAVRRFRHKGARPVDALAQALHSGNAEGRGVRLPAEGLCVQGAG